MIKNYIFLNKTPKCQTLLGPSLNSVNHSLVETANEQRKISSLFRHFTWIRTWYRTNKVFLTSPKHNPLD